MKLRPSIFALSAALFASGAYPLSLGGSLGNVVLGRPLDLRFQIHPEPGANDEALCLSSTVLQGDESGFHTASSAELLPHSVGKSTWVRVRTTAPIQEPVITVRLSAGCTAQLQRSYTFLVDLPADSATQDSSRSVRPLDVTALARAQARRNATAAVPTAGPQPPAPDFSAPYPASTAPVRRPVKVKVEKKRPPAPEVTSDTATAGATPAVTAHTDSGRLLMQPLDGVAKEPPTAPALAATDPATSAAPPAAPFAPSPQEWQQLKAEMGLLRSQVEQLQALQANNQQLQQQLLQLQQERFPATVVYLLLGSLLAALAGAAVLWRRNQTLTASEPSQPITPHWADIVQRPTPAEPSPTSAATPAPTAPAAPTTDFIEAAAPAVPVITPDAEPSTALTDDAVPLPMPSVQVPTLAALQASDSEAESATSALEWPTTHRQIIQPEAIFDLQQQAEFFISVGENEQAINVMQKHIAENEASSPLAYLELLRLYHSLGRMEDFNQLRAVFHQHFNANVPAFSVFNQTGRSLLGYADTLAQIEAIWSDTAVLKLLEDCLFHRSAAQPVFDLQAYDDLMLLYAIAQTTPATSRGMLPPRRRTTPLEDEVDGVTTIAPAVSVVLASPVLPPGPTADERAQGLSMDDFSWLPGQTLDTSLAPSALASAQTAAPASKPTAISSPELAAALAKSAPEKPRMLLDGDESPFDFTLPADLEEELKALAANPAPPKKSLSFDASQPFHTP